tara:strand:+ start:1724 stop:1939 length:216 start_codon:yes stop_codon:yes gene_type:complete
MTTLIGDIEEEFVHAAHELDEIYGAIEVLVAREDEHLKLIKTLTATVKKLIKVRESLEKKIIMLQKKKKKK